MARPKTLSESERKSVRATLLMTPAMFADVSTLTQIKNISLNDLFCSLAAQVIEKNRQEIDKVRAVISEAAETVDLSADET